MICELLYLDRMKYLTRCVVVAFFVLSGLSFALPSKVSAAGTCSSSCASGSTCTCLGEAQTCSGTALSGTFSDCDTASGYTCCQVSSSSSCNASYCKTTCDSSTDDTTQTGCKSVCTNARNRTIVRQRVQPLLVGQLGK